MIDNINYKELYKKFQNNNVALKENDIFVNKKTNKYEYKELKGMRNGIPFFTEIVESTNLLLRSIILKEYNDFIFILNEKSPYEELDGSTCGMSFLHFFVIPKKRIYNAVTLKYNDYNLIKNMKEESIKYFNNNKKLLFNYIYNIINKGLINLKEDNKIKMINKIEEHIKLYNISSGDDLEFYFHPHPYHSVGHLHMHVVLKNIRTNYKHDWKNISSDHILNFLFQNK
jgi:hypothetical protein